MKAWLAVLAVAILAMALLPGLSASPAAAQPPGHWEIACVDCPRWFGDLTDHSLRIDAAGHPHVAYGGDHLYYAYHDGSTWHYETADESPGVGSSAALDLDPAGRPYIAYYDSLNQDLKLAFRDGAGWHVTTVDTGGTDGVVGVITRLAVGVDGQPHIVYLDYSQGSLRYAHPGPQGWLVEDFGNPLDVYFYYDFSLSMAVSTTGVPHVCYFDTVENLLIHAYRSGTGWILETITADYARSCSLALDGSDRPHVAYSSYGHSRIAHWTGTSWEFESIDWQWGSPAGLSLTMDAGGFPHVSATVWVGSEPGWPEWQYKYRDATGWHTVNQGGLITIGQTSLALDANGHPFVGYPTWQGLSMAAFDGVAWQTGAVDTSDDVGRFSSLALDSGGRPVVGYSAKSAGMKVASWNGASWTIDDFSMLRRAGRVTGVSLALDSGDRPHVAHAWDYYSYWDETEYYLTYRSLTPSGWYARERGGFVWRRRILLPIVGRGCWGYASSQHNRRLGSRPRQPFPPHFFWMGTRASGRACIRQGFLGPGFVWKSYHRTYAVFGRHPSGGDRLL